MRVNPRIRVSGFPLLVFLLARNCLEILGATECNNEVGKNEKLPCGGPDSFINLCGLCVGGQTGRANDEGLDKCSVCRGDDRCIGCDGVKGSKKISDACGACLDPEDSLRDNCTKITSVSPNVLDKAVDKVTTVRLRGAGINPTSIPDVSCSLQPLDPQTQQPSKIEKQSVEDGLIQLELSLSDKAGTYAVLCSSNTIGPLESGNQVTLSIVDSKQLCVTDSKPQKVSVDNELQMELTIPTVKDKSNVLCFVRKKGQQTAEVVPATEVTAGKVKCGPFTAKRASLMEWGAAYTWDAATDGESCSPAAALTVIAPPPVIQSAEFANGLSKIHIKFDHNVDGSENCKDIFTAETVELLGKGANCSFVGNVLVVILGSDPKVKEDSELKLLSNGKVYREQSDPSLTAPASGSVKLTPPDPKLSKPQYDMTAPSMICPDALQGSALGNNVPVSSNISSNSAPQVIRISAPSGQKVTYNWTVEFNATAKDQRHNLMVWRSVRMLQTHLQKAGQGNEIPLNTSMLMEGVEYKITVSGKNTLGVEGPKQQFSFKVMPKEQKGRAGDLGTSSQLSLKGPATTWSKADYFVEAIIDTCEPQIVRPMITCEWKIQGEMSQNIEMPKGKMLNLRGGVLQGGKEYNISSTCTSDSAQKTEMTASMSVTVLSQGIYAQVSIQEVTMGTGQALELDASQSQDLDKKPGELQFSWCCRTQSGVRCLLPRSGEAATLESAYKDAFKQPVLKIPEGSLPTGKYIFTIEVSKGGLTSKTQTTVEVVIGVPPTVTSSNGGQQSYVNPKEGVTIPAVVMNTREGCRMWWSVQQEPGHEYFNLAEVVGLGDVVTVTQEEARDVTGREFPLVIPGPTGTWPGLKDSAAYKFRLSIFCPQQGNLQSSLSHSDFVITTNSPPDVKPLKVDPVKGEALRTKFVFSTSSAEDASTDYPLLYRYGFQISDQEQTNFFSSSNEALQATTTLPCVSGTETIIIPVLTVCDVHKLCTTVKGQQVTTTLPNNFTLTEVQEIGVQFSEYIASQQYPEAQSFAQLSLQTLKQMPNQDLYTAAVELIETEIRKELKRKQDGLNGNPVSMQSSLDFLDMSISILSELPMSGSTLQDLAAFKDKILSLSKQNSEYKLKYTSFPDRHSSVPKLRQRRSIAASNVSTPIFMSISNIYDLLHKAEAVIKTGNETVIRTEKKQLLNSIHKYIYHLCVGNELKLKDMKIFISTPLVQFSVEKLLPQDNVLKTEFHIPNRAKGPPTRYQTALINLGKSVNKFGSSGESCLGGMYYPADYLTEVAIGNNTTKMSYKKRVSPVFEARLTNIAKARERTDRHLNLKLPIDSTIIAADQTVKCAIWKENTWSVDDCETGEIIFSQPQAYVECKCSAFGYYMVVVDTPFSVTAVTTLAVTHPSGSFSSSSSVTPTAEGTISSSIALIESTSSSSMPLMEGTSSRIMPLTESTISSSMPLTEGTSSSMMPLIDSTIASSMPLMEGTSSSSMPLMEGTSSSSMPLTEGTSSSMMPLIDSTITSSMPLMEGTISSMMPVTESTISRSMPLTEGTSSSRMPLTEGTSSSSMPLTESTSSSNMPLTEGTSSSTMPLTESTISSSMLLIEGTNSGRMPLTESTISSSMPLTEATSSSRMPLNESIISSTMPLMEGTSSSRMPRSEGTSSSSMPLTESTISSSTRMPLTESTISSSMPLTESLNSITLPLTGTSSSRSTTVPVTITVRSSSSIILSTGTIKSSSSTISLALRTGSSSTRTQSSKIYSSNKNSILSTRTIISGSSTMLLTRTTNSDSATVSVTGTTSSSIITSSVDITDSSSTTIYVTESTDSIRNTLSSTVIPSSTIESISLTDTPKLNNSTSTIDTIKREPVISTTRIPNSRTDQHIPVVPGLTENKQPYATKVKGGLSAAVMHIDQEEDFFREQKMVGVPVSNATYNVSFRIEDDYSIVVGERKKEFEQQILFQLWKQIDIPSGMIQGIEVTPGSIKVTLMLADTDVRTAMEVITLLNRAIQNGELEMHGLDNQRLNVPGQKATIVELYKTGTRLKVQKRSIASSSESSSTIMSISNIHTTLRVSEAVIKSGNETDVLQEKEKLLSDIHKYIFHLCVGNELKPNNNKIYINSPIVQLSVEKLLSQEHITLTEFRLPNRVKGPPSVDETALVNLGKAMANKYGPSGVICLGGIHFPLDYLTDVAVGKYGTKLSYKKRVSPVFEAKLTNVGKAPEKLDNDKPLTLKLPVGSVSIEANEVLKCALWQENSWTVEECETGEIIYAQSQAYMVCKCMVLGYYTVVAVDSPSTTSTVSTTTFSTTASTPTTTFTSSSTSSSSSSSSSTSTETSSSSTMIDTTSVSSNIKDEECKNLPSDRLKGVPVSNATYNVSFKIEEDFKAVVGENKEKFEQKIRCEILTYVTMPGRMIREIDVAPGSIIVTVMLVDTDVKTAKEVIPALAKAIQNGDIQMHGLQNQKLNVPRQEVIIVEPYKSEKSHVIVYAVVGCVILSTISIVGLVAGAVIKKKKDAEKLKRQQVPAVAKGVPTYRKFQFEHSIEGTEASLARYRSSYPTMGTAGTLMMGTAMGMGMGGTQMMAFANRAGQRYEPQGNGNQYLHPDVSYNASQTSKKKKKKKQKQGVQRAGSLGGLLNQEEIPQGDQDSGIVDGYTNSSDDKNVRNRNRVKKNSNGSEFDILPGTPTDDV